MATIDWDKLLAGADDFGKEILDVVKPFAPALAREGPEVYEGFIKRLFDKDFESIDAYMYSRLTLDERRKLEKDVLDGAITAARAKFRQRELVKDVMFKVLLRVLIRASVG